MSGRERILIGTLLLMLAAISAVDILVDYGQGVSLRHLFVEILLLALCLSFLGYLAIEWRRMGSALSSTRQRLADTHQDLARWRREAEAYLAGLGATIDAQFELWSLTQAEKEVGLLILKGLSFREIAQLRGSAERTVRQQAQAIYRKAGLANRSEFAAFFLEDLLLPGQEPS